jgi:general secretion pathway protein A
MGRLAQSVNALGRRLEEHQQAARHLEEQLRRERAGHLLATMRPAVDAAFPAVAAATRVPATVDDTRPDVAMATGAPAVSVAAAEPTAPGLDATTAAAIDAVIDGPGEEYWGVREPPFENAPNPRFLWLSPMHSEALVRLTYALRQRRGCAVLTGEPGCGKTLLTRAVVQRLEPSRYEIGLLTNPHGGRMDLLRQVLYELGIETAETNRTELLHTLHDLIVGNARRGRETLVIVDDAQQADDPAWFEELSALLNVQTNERTLVTILLAGTPDLIPLVRQVQHLDRRVSLRCTLGPLDDEQVARYIRYRLGVAGGNASIFTREAIAHIHEASRGVPRAINDLCDSALLLARLDRLRTIDEAVLHRVLGAAPTSA